MIKPLPLSSLARLTLFPGVPSTSSTDGMGSPTLTILTVVVWKLLREIVVAKRGAEELLRMRCRMLSIDVIWKEVTGRFVKFEY